LEIISGYVEVHVFRYNNQKIEYLLLRRGDKVIYPGLWQIVTGKIKEGEKAYETALREVQEETGLVPERLWVAPKVNQFYSAEKDAIYIVPVFAAELKLVRVLLYAVNIMISGGWIHLMPGKCSPGMSSREHLI
jgi:dihydroneopterin triphosphate diphosphatase